MHFRRILSPATAPLLTFTLAKTDVSDILK